MPTTPGLASTLAHRDFALVWAGGLISYVGHWARFTALAFYVYDQTESALASAAVPALMGAPMLLTTVAGVWLDRWDRRRTLVSANLVMAIATLPLFAAGPNTLWVVYASTLVVSTAGILVGPAENALLPRLVGTDRLIHANALNALNDNLGRIIGPVVGGTLFAVGGFATVVSVNAATYVTAAILIASVRTRSRESPVVVAESAKRRSWPRRVWEDWRSGLRMLATTPTIGALFAVAAIASAGDAILSGLLAPFIVEVLSGDESALGLFLTIRGAGGLIGGYLVGRWIRRLSPMRMVGAGTLLIGLTIAAVAGLPSIPMLLAAGVPLGTLVVVWLASQQTQIQRAIGDAHLGRAFGTLATLTAGMMLIGTTLGGATADLVGIRPLLAVAAILYGTAGLLAWSVATVRR